MIMVFGGVVESPASQRYQSRKKPALYLWNGKQAWIISLNILEFSYAYAYAMQPSRTKKQANGLFKYQ